MENYGKLIVENVSIKCLWQLSCSTIITNNNHLCVFKLLIITNLLKMFMQI